MFSVHATAVPYFLSTAPSNVSGPLSAGPRTVFTPVLVENRFCGKIFVDAFTAKRLCTIFALFWKSCNNFSKFACSTLLIQNNVDNPSLLRWICWKRVAKIQRLRGGHIWILQRLDWALKAWTAFLYNALPWPIGQAHSVQFSLLLLCCNTVSALRECCLDKCEITSSQPAKYLRRAKLLLRCKLTTFLEEPVLKSL